MKYKIRMSVYFLLFTGIGLRAGGLNDSDSIKSCNIDEVVVTATRISRNLSSLPLPVKVISEGELRKTNVSRLSDIIAQQTGLLVVPDYGYGNGEGIQMQGFDSQYVMIMVDGMPLIGRSAGTLDLERVNIGNVKRIEIIKGASSSLYGSEALGGVVNVITGDPKNGFGGEADYKYSTFNTNDANLNLHLGYGKVGTTFYLNRNGSAGYSLDKSSGLKTVEPYTDYTFNNRILYNIDARSELSTNLRYYYQKQNQTYLNGGVSLAGYNFLREMESMLKYNICWNEHLKGEASVYYTTYNTTDFELSPNGGEMRGYFKQMMLRPELRFVYSPLKSSQISFGGGYDYETLGRTDFASKAFYRSEFAYGQLESEWLRRWNLLAGFRYDHHNIYGAQWSPKAGIRYRLNDRISLLSSLGYGFKAPDFRQLYLDFTNAGVGYTVLGTYVAATQLKKMEQEGLIQSLVNGINGNGGLKPETSVNWNFGFRWDPEKKIRVEANLFYNHLKNMISTRTVAYKTNGQSVYSYYNINKVHTQGLEANVSWNVNKHLQISGGYQLLYALDDSAVAAFKGGEVYARDNNNHTVRLKKSDYFGLPERSRHMADFKLFYEIPEWKLDMNVRAVYRSKYGMYDTNSNGYIDNRDQFVPGYALVYLAANKRIGKYLTLSAGADNLFAYTDRRYISNLPGRIVYGKLTFNF